MLSERSKIIIGLTETKLKENVAKNYFNNLREYKS